MIVVTYVATVTALNSAGDSMDLAIVLDDRLDVCIEQSTKIFGRMARDYYAATLAISQERKEVSDDETTGRQD